MPSDVAPAPAATATTAASRVRNPGWLLPLAAAAMASVVLFRAGIAPGGQVGVDVLLACAGWWFGSVLVTSGSARVPWGEALHRIWPSVLAVLLGAIGWVALTPQNGQDRVVRGAALAVLGGYGNWHLIAVGPTEAGPTHLVSPLQSLWPFGIAVQAALLVTVIFAISVTFGTLRRGRPHPMVVPTLAVGLVLLAWGVVVLLGDATPDRILADGRIRGVAFVLAAGIGAAGTSHIGRTARSIVGTISMVAAALLAVGAVVAEPGSSWWLDGGSVVSAVLAVAVVAAAAPWPPRRLADPRAAVDGSEVDARPGLARAVDPWTVLVAVFFLHGPVLALLAPVRTHLPWLLARLVGLAVLAVVASGVAWLTGRLSRSPEASERRRVLAPPAFVACLVVLASLTGAFHWEGPRDLTKHETDTRSSEGNEPG